MAVAYLNAGSTTLAAGGWSDSTGFASGATLVIPDGNQIITTAVDQNAVTHSLYLRIMRPFSGGIGTASSPLNVRISDGTAAEKTSANTEGFIQYLASGGYLYVKAAGTTSGTDAIDNFFQNSVGKVWLVGNLFSWYHLENGPLDVDTNTIITTFDAYGGAATVAAQATPTDFTTVNIWGGQHVIKRTATTMNLYGGTTTIDYETVGGGAFTTVNLHNGATLVHRAGDITTLNHNAGGIHDTTSMRRQSTIATCIRKPRAQFTGRRSGDLLVITTDTTIGFPTQ